MTVVVVALVLLAVTAVVWRLIEGDDAHGGRPSWGTAAARRSFASVAAVPRWFLRTGRRVSPADATPARATGRGGPIRHRRGRVRFEEAFDVTGAPVTPARDAPDVAAAADRPSRLWRALQLILLTIVLAGVAAGAVWFAIRLVVRVFSG